MNIQRKKIATGFLFLLAIGIVGFFIYDRSKSTSPTDPAVTFFPGNATPSEITKVIIQKNGVETIIATPADSSPDAPNDQSKWVFVSDNNSQADSADINQLIILLKEMKFRSIASENKNSLASFDLDEQQARRVRLFLRGVQVADILVGKGGPGGASSYVTSDTENKVYLMDRNITILLDLDFHKRSETE